MTTILELRARAVALRTLRPLLKPPPADITPPLPAHLPALDGLRGLAILLVMAHHFLYSVDGSGLLGQSLLKLARMGWVGVDLFFVLSGFLITGILLDARDRVGQTATTAQYFRNFYARRILRIFPLYYATLAVLFLLLPHLISFSSYNLTAAQHSQTWLWLYGTNFALPLRIPGFVNPHAFITSHFWSLAVEEHFYLFWPLVVYFCTRKQLITVCLVTMGLAAALRFASLAAGASLDVPYMITPCRMDALAFGGLLAVAVRGRGGLAPLLKPALLAGFVCAAAACVVFARTRQFGPVMWIIESLKFTVLAFLFGVLLLRTIGSDVLPHTCPWTRRIFTLPALQSLGKYAYGIYIFHLLLRPAYDYLFGIERLQYALHSYPLAVILYCALATAASIAVALASWHLFEKHFLKWKRLFA